MTDTFSSNSLKILDKDLNEFKNKYIDNLTLFKNDKRAILGQKFHSLICASIKGFNTEKFEKSLEENELKNWLKLKEKLEIKRNGFIKTEYSFLVKNFLNKKPYYLTGRFDAVFKEENNIIIYDWKTLNIPKNPENDLQTIVYLYCAEKIYKTKNIKMKYLSIEKQISEEIAYKNEETYRNIIENIISKTDDYKH